MSAARTATAGLSTQDLQSIRDTLAAGRKPKVTFTETAGQIAGQLGQVVELTDPEVNEEFVVVRFGRDELPFSPTDLAIPAKMPARKAASKVEFKEEPAPEPEFKITQPPVPLPREERVMSTSTMSATPATPVPPTEASDAEVAKSAPRKAVKQVKPKPPSALIVTISYTEGEWTVGAQQGGKVLAKPYVIKPADALKMVGLLDVPGVQEAVEHIVSTERTEAEQQALRLRAELAEVEAKLAELSAT